MQRQNYLDKVCSYQAYKYLERKKNLFELVTRSPVMGHDLEYKHWFHQNPDIQRLIKASQVFVAMFQPQAYPTTKR